MKKKGFTLVEILVVIGILGLLVGLVVPNVLKTYKNINERSDSQNINYIETSAELYALDDDSIFNQSDIVYVYVQDLLEKGYITANVKYGEGICLESNVDNSQSSRITKTGCMVNSSGDKESEIINFKKVKLEKKVAGVVATYNDNGNGNNTSNKTLVKAVCEGFGTSYNGKTLNDSAYCKCNDNNNILYKYSDNKLTEQLADGDACIIVSNKDSGMVDNWLKYGSEEANWRVIGLYNIDGTLYAKIISSETVD